MFCFFIFLCFLKEENSSDSGYNNWLNKTSSSHLIERKLFQNTSDLSAVEKLHIGENVADQHANSVKY